MRGLLGTSLRAVRDCCVALVMAWRRTCRTAALLAIAASSMRAQTSVAAPPRTTTASQAETTDSARAFGRLVQSLSEAGGYFDTDNLISNERSYLHVVGAFERLGVRGGAYIGVGPDQNFSYIARIRPSIAFLIDIRRDNMLQHLMFKALFARSRNRCEYLALLLGRAAPTGTDQWNERSIDALVALMDSTPVTERSAAAARVAVMAEVRASGVTLSADDLATIERFHRTFITSGLGLQFTTTGRAPQPYYPTLRQLLLERDLDGRRASYLANESDFQFVKSLQQQHRIIPVVGDLAGPHALPSIGRLVAQRGETVSALYASNAEDYLLRDGSFPVYARSVAALPHNARSVMIRSFFGGNSAHPESVAGYYSTQLLQTIDSFNDDVRLESIVSYRQLVQRHFIQLRP